MYRLTTRSILRRRFSTSVRALANDRSESSWDYLTDPQELELSDDLKDLNLKTELDDLYATPASQKMHQGERRKEKVSFVVKPQSKPVSGNELEDVFRPRRRMSDTSGVAGVTATQKEREIFSKIFDTILSRSASDGGRSAQNKTGLSSNMQALFEKTLGTAQPTEDQDVQLGMTTDDVRKYPLSMASLIMSQKPGKENRTHGLEFNNALKEKLQPVFEHIDAFETDYDLAQYYEEKIVNAYKASMKNSRSKQPEITKLEDLDSLVIDPESPPVSSRVLPLILYNVIRTMMHNFNSPEQALMLFELSKQQGIDFYVSSCNCDVYNEVLRIKWDAYKDLYLVESLISEMDINGLKANSETSEILGAVARYAIDMKQGSLDSKHVPLWSQEDEERLMNLNRYRLRALEALVQQDNAGQGKLLSQLINI